MPMEKIHCIPDVKWTMKMNCTFTRSVLRWIRAMLRLCFITSNVFSKLCISQKKLKTMKLTVSFPVGTLDGIAVNELYKELYSSITQVISEHKIVGIQLYPAQWPRKHGLTHLNKAHI